MGLFSSELGGVNLNFGSRVGGRICQNPLRVFLVLCGDSNEKCRNFWATLRGQKQELFPVAAIVYTRQGTVSYKRFSGTWSH